MRRVHLPLFKSMSYLAADREGKILVSTIDGVQSRLSSSPLCIQRVTDRKKDSVVLTLCMGSDINDVTITGLLHIFHISSLINLN